MKHHWIILALILLFQSDNFISIDEQRINLMNKELIGLILLLKGPSLKVKIPELLRRKKMEMLPFNRLDQSILQFGNMIKQVG